MVYSNVSLVPLVDVANVLENQQLLILVEFAVHQQALLAFAVIVKRKTYFVLRKSLLFGNI